MPSTYLVTGASRGIGQGLATGVPLPGDTVWLVSRSQPSLLERSDGVTRHWLRWDLRQPGIGAEIRRTLAVAPLDALIYNAGIWERTAWSNSYRFEAIDPVEHQAVMAVNLASAMESVQGALPALRRAANPKVILIGSTSGLEHAATQEVAYSATKFALRGMAHALRHSLRDAAISVTCLNPGSVATHRLLDEGREAVLAEYGADLIPLQDLVDLVRTLLRLSRATCVKEIDLPAMGDRNC
jgi:short-subunit dehydrogenase